MSRGRGHRGGLMAVGTELNIVPYLDMMTVLVLFLLVNITSFLSFTILNASIPQIAPDSAKAQAEMAKKEQLLLIVRVTRNGFVVDPSVQGGKTIDRIVLQQKTDSTKGAAVFDFERLRTVAVMLKNRFPQESRVLIIAEPKIIYDDIIQTMDALREQEDGANDMFRDVTLSVL